MTAFNLERAGVPLTAADLQASLGGKDVGVMDNVTIGPMKDAPAPLAMAVVVRAGQRDAARPPLTPRVARRFPGSRAYCRARPAPA